MKSAEALCLCTAPRRGHSREAKWVSARLRASPALRETCRARDRALRYVFDRKTKVRFRPDGLFVQSDRSLVVEYDEHQHVGYTGKAEEHRTLRIARVIRELACPGACVFLRFNPDQMFTRRDGGPGASVRDSMFDRAVELLARYRPPPRSCAPLCIYFFYDSGAGAIAMDLPRIHVRDEADMCVLGERLEREGWTRTGG